MARYGFDYTPAQAGQIADASLRDIISLPAQVGNDDIGKARGPIGFGYPVQVLVATLENEAVVRVVDNLNNHIIGIAVFSHCRENQKSNISGAGKRDANYLHRDVVSVLNKGRVWVYTSEDVKEGEIAYIAQPASGDCVDKFTNTPTSGSPATNNKEIGIFMSNSIIVNTTETTVNGIIVKIYTRIAVLEFDLSAHAAGIQGL